MSGIEAEATIWIREPKPSQDQRCSQALIDLSVELGLFQGLINICP